MGILEETAYVDKYRTTDMDLCEALEDALQVIDNSECFLPEEMTKEENEHFNDLNSTLAKAKKVLEIN